MKPTPNIKVDTLLWAGGVESHPGT